MKKKKKGMKEMPLTQVIIIIASLVIAFLLIAFSFNIWRTSKSQGDKMNNQITSMGAMMDEEQFTGIEGKNVSGNEVISYLRSWKDKALCVKVVTKTQSSGSFYNFKNYNTSTGLQSNQKRSSEENSTMISDATNQLKPNYINPNGQFLVELVRDNNSTIIAVTFTQQ